MSSFLGWQFYRSTLYMKCVQKVLKIKTVYTKIEMKFQWNINFLHKSLLGIQQIYFSRFSIG